MSDANPTVPPAEPPSLTAKLDEIFKTVNRSDAPGLVVGVAHHGKVIYRRGFGLASVELGVANTPRTRMRIGSTSKHVASLAALLLAEDGKLDIDAPVRTYLPEVPALPVEPTVRQLMNHTSGYRCYLDIGFLSDGNVIRPKGEAIAAQLRQTGINFPAGERMIYCNGGYQLLSLIIERQSGLSFEAFMKQRVFEPMGMIDTDSVPSDFEITPGAAVLHIPLPGGGLRRGIFPSEEVRGEGAMISTIDDMLRWIAHLRGPKRVGSDASWAQMLTMTRLTNGTVNPYGLGLMRHAWRGVEVIHHAGGVVGGSAQMITVPAHELDVVIMNNGGLLAPTEAANKVIDAVLGEGVLTPVPEAPKAERFKPMVGTRYHSSRSGFEFGFVDSEGKLALSIVNSQGLPLSDAGAAIQMNFEDGAVGPLRLDTAHLATEGEAPAELVLSEAGNAETYARLPTTPPVLKDAGQALVGRYRAADLDADARVEFVGDALRVKVLGHFGTSELDLEAFSADVFGWKALDPLLPLTGSLSVERGGSGADEPVTGFRVDTPRTRHMQFKRV